MSDGKCTGGRAELHALMEQLREFVSERDWEQFHSPKNLAMALVVEAAELVEIFQWMTEEASDNLTPQEQQRVEEEIADVMTYVMRIADRLGIDLFDAVERKLVTTRQKYPASRVRGSAKKYTEYKL